MLELAIEYYCLVFVAATGVIQASAGHGEDYLFFFKNKLHGYIFTGLTVIPVMAGLFTWNYRNPTGIIEGAQQFFLFLLAAASAILVSAAMASIVRTTVNAPEKRNFKGSAKNLYRSNNNQDDRSI